MLVGELLLDNCNVVVSMIVETEHYVFVSCPLFDCMSVCSGVSVRAIVLNDGGIGTPEWPLAHQRE